MKKIFSLILVVIISILIGGCGKKPDIVTTADIFLTEYHTTLMAEQDKIKKIKKDKSLDRFDYMMSIFSKYSNKKIEMTGNVYTVQKSLDGRVFAIIGLNYHESICRGDCVFAIFKDENDIRKLYKKQQGKVAKIFDKIVVQKEGDGITVCGTGKNLFEFICGTKQKAKELYKTNKEKFDKMGKDFEKNFYSPIRDSSFLDKTFAGEMSNFTEFIGLFMPAIFIDDARIVE